MKKKTAKLNLIFLIVIFSFFLNSCFFIEVNISKEKERKKTTESIPLPKPHKTGLFEKLSELKNSLTGKNFNFLIPAGSKLESFEIDSVAKKITLQFNNSFAEHPFREENIKTISNEMYKYLNISETDYSITLIAQKKNLEELIPNFYRKNIPKDDKRVPLLRPKLSAPLVTNLNKPYLPTAGLLNKNIVLWHSHGWYYANELNRWEWQRPRLFQNIEDLGPMSFTIPYLIPMLENAGAKVFVPRERDIQTNEVIIDNDNKNDIKKKYYLEKGKGIISGSTPGYATGNIPYKTGDNPFTKGTHRILRSGGKEQSVSFIPKIPESGTYSVYVSYVASENNVTDAKYIVYHLGGKTEFEVNQQAGGSTWLLLGFFNFSKGYNPLNGRVEIVNKSPQTNNLISADAVRFGGGIGVVERGGETSGRPKFTEGARYYLQFLGMPDTLVYSLNQEKNDYKDDYQSRNEYVNYLIGKPFGPNKKRDEKGLGIPVDLSLAFHTDAGISRNDTVIGTLSIYSIKDYFSKTEFPDSSSRMANRDLADILQTQIVDDIRAKYDPVWQRRQLRDADYAESVRPNVPSVLLELLSHQNFLDMKFLQDPRFRFDVSRSIYKAFLKYISNNNNTEYIVAPLPVTHFTSELDNSGNILLSWKPTDDKLEPSAIAEKYIVYTRINDGGFDNGFLCENPFTIIKNPKPGVIYSFKVTAVNKGGESFPSEILSVHINKKNKKPLIIVNCFDRICGPATVETNSFSGFFDNIDKGVPDVYQLNYCGQQYDFDPKSQFLTNDSPGWGASESNFETKIIAGNNHDYVFTHGKIFAKLGYSFVSASDEALEDGIVNLNNFSFADLIFGEEKETGWPKVYGDTCIGKQFRTFTKELQKSLLSFLNNKGKLFLSGSYIASDISLMKPADSSDIKFLNNVLKYKWSSVNSSGSGEVVSVSSKSRNKINLIFNTKPDNKIYEVESPDGLINMKDSEILFRYQENQFGAVVGYKKEYGVVAAGFPFETIINETEAELFMKSILNYLQVNE